MLYKMVKERPSSSEWWRGGILSKMAEDLPCSQEWWESGRAAIILRTAG